MKILEYEELFVVGGGDPCSAFTGVVVMSVGAALGTAGMLCFTPLKPGDEPHKLTRGFNMRARIEEPCTLFTDYDVVTYIIRTNRPIIPLNPLVANVVLWYGIGCILGGIVMCFGSR